jgi:multiple sugar transport system permease protein
MKSHRWFTPWVLVLPALVWLAAFNLWPAVRTVYLSFTNTRALGGGEWIGLENYRKIFESDRLTTAIVNSLFYMAVCLPLLTFGPLLLAVLVQKQIPGIGFFRTSFYLPVVASVVAAAVIWDFLLQPQGAVNTIADKLGFIQKPLPFLTDRWLLNLSAISLTVWKGMGYYMVIYLAALGNVRKELYEACSVDGGGTWRQFRAVTIPGVRPMMLLIAVLISVSGMRVFAEPYILTNGTGGPGGRNSTLVMLIQDAGTGTSGRIGYAAALSLVMFVITIGPMGLLARLNRKETT